MSETSMSIWQRRVRMAGLAIILILAAVLAFDIENTQPTYAESAVVLFAMPAYQTAVTAATLYTWYAPALITTGDAVTQIVMNSQSQTRIQAMGGTASYGLTLINLYNQDYPNYSYPDATLTAVSASPAETHWTFMVAARALNRTLAARKAAAGGAPVDRISVRIIGDSGPMVQTGSHKRALAGLTLLAILAGTSAWGFLGRWDPDKASLGRIRA